MINIRWVCDGTVRNFAACTALWPSLWRCVHAIGEAYKPPPPSFFALRTPLHPSQLVPEALCRGLCQTVSLQERSMQLASALAVWQTQSQIVMRCNWYLHRQSSTVLRHLGWVPSTLFVCPPDMSTAAWVCARDRTRRTSWRPVMPLQMAPEVLLCDMWASMFEQHTAGGAKQRVNKRPPISAHQQV